MYIIHSHNATLHIAINTWTRGLIITLLKKAVLAKTFYMGNKHFTILRVFFYINTTYVTNEGQARPFQYKDHTVWPHLPTNFQCVHVSQTNPSEWKYLIYYLKLWSTKHVTINIKWMFFRICFIKLSSMYTLVYQNRKVPKVGVAPFARCAGPLCPSYWAKGATLRANIFGL